MISDIWVHLVERTREKDPFRYVLTTEQMIENGYPMPSYMADIFEKTDGWVEVPKGPDEEPDSKEKMRIWSIDCEMVGYSISLIGFRRGLIDLRSVKRKKAKY